MSARPEMSLEGAFPSLAGATGWLNSQPLTPEGLRGKVVLVNFWTYSCINWIRSLPYVRAWADRYGSSGLVVIGVHTPEFQFEHDVQRIRKAAADMRVEYPIAIDSDYAVWDAFDNRYWPALYFLDAAGMIRHHRFGEGDYEQSEAVIRSLLGEAGLTDAGDDRSALVDPSGVEAPADWESLGSPETYLGFARGANLASPGGAALGAPRVYSLPDRLGLNEWGLSGDWTVESEAARLNEPDGRIAFRFHARDLHLVMGPAADGATIRFRVLIDGQAPRSAHGIDIDEQGEGVASELRMHQLVRQHGSVDERTFQITFLDAGAAAYVFTFG